MTTVSAVAGQEGHGIRVAVPGAPGEAVLDELRLMDRDGVAARMPLRLAEQRNGATTLTADGAGFEARIRLDAAPGGVPGLEARSTLHYVGGATVARGVRIPLRLTGGGPPGWLIPACFYGENRLRQCTSRYPRYDARGADPAALVSDRWSFRADRSAVPVVFGWSAGICASLAIDETTPLGPAGLGFAGRAGEDPEIWLDAPFREEPVVYDGSAAARPAHVELAQWEPGSERTLHFTIDVRPPDPHAYDPVVRALYARDRVLYPLRPWMDAGQAAELVAFGIHRWHYHADDRVLYETAAFDRSLAGDARVGDRPHMHVAWLSGAPAAAALLRYGRRSSRAEYIAAGSAVLDAISGALSPSGLFWGEWRRGAGWSGGWNPDRSWVHTRTIAEATLFMVRALKAERARGVDHPAWERAIRSNLDAVVRLQGRDGTFGTYVDAESGIVREWDGAGGLCWIPALVEGSTLLALPAGFGDAAFRAGEGYARYVEGELIYGAPEDIHLAPSSEDGYDAVMAYVALFEATAEARWLDLARRAADWTMTFRWTYDVTFEPRTVLGRHRFASRGADGASPANQHLHGYGLICVPELVRLAGHAADPYYEQRAMDHVQCFRQFIARHDGDFGAMRGMVTERYYHTDCFGPKGDILPLSHAWCLGLALWANLAELDGFDALP